MVGLVPKLVTRVRLAAIAGEVDTRIAARPATSAVPAASRICKRRFIKPSLQTTVCGVVRGPGSGGEAPTTTRLGQPRLNLWLVWPLQSWSWICWPLPVPDTAAVTVLRPRSAFPTTVYGA
ncbi:hypothetical protein GCM10020358_59210 [Amorphoplanes nipponensis]